MIDHLEIAAAPAYEDDQPVILEQLPPESATAKVNGYLQFVLDDTLEDWLGTSPGLNAHQTAAEQTPSEGRW